jgi:hypothetical protein
MTEEVEGGIIKRREETEGLGYRGLSTVMSSYLDLRDPDS